MDLSGHFPKRGDSAAVDAWAPFTAHCALDRNVLCVATTRIEGAWSAYVAAVPGVNHGRERAAVPALS